MESEAPGRLETAVDHTADQHKDWIAAVALQQSNCLFSGFWAADLPESDGPKQPCLWLVSNRPNSPAALLQG